MAFLFRLVVLEMAMFIVVTTGNLAQETSPTL